MRDKYKAKENKKIQNKGLWSGQLPTFAIILYNTEPLHNCHSSYTTVNTHTKASLILHNSGHIHTTIIDPTQPGTHTHKHH